jgi:predicted AAA+ superfamily ATPase
VATYLQRDVRGLIAVRDETRFGVFLSLCAALTAQECNYSQMGRDIGVTTPTAQKWLGVMRGTYQWIEIPAYSNNAIKRLSMKPKGYVTDSGLACYLQRISSPESLSGHPLFGAMFETSVVMDIVKQSQALDFPPAFHHYRLHSGAEVDLVLEMDNRLFPIEIKASSRARPGDAGGISRFQEQVGERAGPGLIVYAGGAPHRLTDRCIAIPYDLDLGVSLDPRVWRPTTLTSQTAFPGRP